MTSRGTANVLTRATAILAGLFFATSLLLSILAGYQPQADLDPAEAARARRPRPAPPAPLDAGGGLLKQLQQGAPAAPPRPLPRPGRRCRSRNKS